jgi:formyltetrahydrofolate-dependent phosphoribosylglycinamide formyltransferase
MKVIVHIDGGSRGNPGPAAAGFILDDVDGQRLAAKAFFLGETTNNVAEYTALLKALEAAKTLGATDLAIYSDSELMVRQLSGLYKVKSDAIRPLYTQAVELRSQFDRSSIRHVMREKNKEADRLVNLALDAGRDIEEKPPRAGAPHVARAHAAVPPSDVSKPGTAEGTFTVAARARPAVSKSAARQQAGPGAGRKKLRLGILISGGGRTMMNILEGIERGELNAQIAVVISSLANVTGVGKARNAGLPVRVIRKKDYADIDAFSRRIAEELDAAQVDLVVQGGWLCLWKIPPQYVNRVMNIHPALLPCFGGQGMWGHHVHEAVLAAGCKVSGCTVHFCTNEYDKGPIIVQRTCPVEDDDTPDTLAARVFEQECLAYPEAIKLCAEGRLEVEGNRARVKRAE